MDVLWIEDMSEIEDIELVYRDKMVGFDVTVENVTVYFDTGHRIWKMMIFGRRFVSDREILMLICGLFGGIEIRLIGNGGRG